MGSSGPFLAFEGRFGGLKDRLVLQVAPSTRTSRRSLRPPKRPSKAKNGQNITFLAISGSVLSDFAFLPSSPLKREKNAAFGSHVALSVLQIDWGSSPHSPESTTRGSPKIIPLPSPLFFFHFFGQFLDSNHSMVVSGAYYNPFQGS